jgi:hypothetical protein
MSERRHGPDLEQRLRRAADTAASRQAPDPSARADEQDDDAVAAARRRRAENQTKWADLQVRQAMARGDFDNLPGAGKPLRGIGATHDPEWWVKGLIEREKITGVGPPALALRKEDAELDARLDRETTATAVRRVVEDFNARIVEARRQLLGGPPVITPLRDVEREVAAWQGRRARRRALLQDERQARRAAGREPEAGNGSQALRRRPWWRVRRWA